MKLTTIIIFVFSLHVSANVLSQSVTLSVKNAPVQKVLKQISRQTGLSLIYNESYFEDMEPVSINVDDVPLDEVLDLCFGEDSYSYQVKDNMVFINRNEKREEAPQQPINITGKVSDKNGNALPGVNVKIKETFNGVATDAEGKYSLSVPENSILVFTHIGMQKQEIKAVAGNTVINVVMLEEVEELMDVQVISTGYQKINPEQSTGSIAKVGVKEFDSRINTTDFSTGLENKVPGLLINNDIEFEGNSLFQIRGISTINGNKQPLIVVDGFPTELSINMINPNEIESVTVLKDAAAATIYGVRASNGVIIIERKKAKIGKVNVNFRATAGFTPKEDYSRYRWDEDASNISINYFRMANAPRIRPNRWEYLNSPTQGSYYNDPTPGLIMAQQVAGVITEAEAEQMFAELGSYNNTEDYGRLFLRMASTQTYNLDISGGDKNALYYITANYVNNKASQIENDNSRFQLSGRTSVKYSERFSMELTTDYQESKASSVPIPSITSIYPYERFEDENGNPLPLYNGSYINPYYNQAIMELGLLDNMYYPLIDINEVSNNSHTLNNRITANFRYNIGNGINVNFGGVYESSRTDMKYIASENSSIVHQYINVYTESDEGELYYNIPKGGFMQQQTASTESYTLRAQLNYDKQLSETHSLNAILGTEIRDVVDKASSAAYFGYNDQTLLHLPIDYSYIEGFSPTFARVNPKVSYDNLFGQGYTENRYVSFYSNLVYSYKNKYSITGSIRIDQSNLFGTDPKYHYKPLWSLGAAWNIHKENFLQDIDWLKSLKYRVAYGFNGNVAKNALPQVIARSSFNYFNPANITPMLSLFSYANSGLRWEQTRNFNTGLDFSLFKGVSGNIDYYSKKSTDLLATSLMESTSGATTALINKASIRNNGFEITLNADWITRKTFNWNTGLIFSHNTSKVLEVYNKKVTPNSNSGSYTTDYVNYLKGYPLAAIFSYRYAGVDAYGYPLVYDKEGETKRIRTSDEGIDDVDYLGTAIPVYNAGLSNRVDVGNFYFYCMVNFYGGFKARVPFPAAASTRPLEGAGNYWKESGDEETPGILPKSYTDYAAYTDEYTTNGAYITLGDVTASYSFRDSKFVKQYGISNFEVRLQAHNLYTVGLNKYNYSVATGNYAKSYLTPTYTVGLYVNF